MPTEHDPNAKCQPVIGWHSTQTKRVSSNMFNLSHPKSNKEKQPALGERLTIHLEISFADAGLLREVLNIAFREAWRCSDPSLFDGTGALQLAITRLHKSIEQQLGQEKGGTR
jgi:hypothetical protein